MAHATIADQMVVEHQMLKHLTDGLRTALDWKPQEADVSRKLSTIRFIAQALQRHLDHLLALEEDDGYMDAAVNLSPHLSRRVAALRQEHDQFRQATQQAVHRLEQASSTDPTPFDNVCEDLLALLQKLEEHSKKEMHLVHEAFQRDSGGEG